MSRHRNSDTGLTPAEVPLIHLKGHSLQPSLQYSHAVVRPSDDDIPKQAKKFSRSHTNVAVEVLVDVLLGLLSAVFLIYGLAVAHFNGRPVAGYPRVTETLLNASKIGPTIFPILFAAMLGRAIKAVMLWRLERGEKLGFLDLLAGSTTIFNTVTSQISLRVFHVAGLVLFVAWALSPLGGQASLRVVSIAQQNSSSTSHITYMSMNASYVRWEMGDLALLGPVRNGIYTAALLGPGRVKSSAQDLWSNVKVPYLEGLTNDSALLANNTWMNVPAEGVTYASLMGIPVSGLPPSHNATFSMETFYWRVDCSNLTDTLQPAFVANPNYNGTNPTGWANFSGELSSTHLFTYSAPDRCLLDPYGAEYPPRTLAYNGYWAGSQFGAMCRIWTSYVEVEVHCTGANNCSATSIRNSTQKHPNPAWTTLDDINGYGPVTQEYPAMCSSGAFYWFLESFVIAIPDPGTAYSTPVQGYLLDPNSPAAPAGGSVSTVPKETFAVRLAQLLNTFWAASAGPFTVPYGLTNTKTSGYGATIANTTAESTETFDIISCHKDWLGVLLVSSIFLLAASIASIVLRLLSKTPELALNWSTLTRDNPYVRTPNGISSLDQTRRSKLMKDTKVRLGDVEPDKDVGHLAVGSLGLQAVAKMRKGRFFD